MGGVINPGGGGGGGGGLAGTTVKTIGTSGDYSDVAAAIAAESTPYHFVLVSDVTEDSDVAVDGVMVLDLDRYTLTMGNNAFTYAAAADVYIRGAGVDSGAEIDYTHTTSVALFNNVSFNTSIVDAEGVFFDNNSSADTTVVCRGINRFRNCRFDVPDQNLAGLFVGVTSDRNWVENCHFVGAGTSCQRALSVSDGTNCTVSDIYVSGTWSTTAGQPSLQFSGNVTVSGLYFNAAATSIQCGAQSVVSNITNSTGNEVDVQITGAAAQVINAYLGSGDIDVQTHDECRFVNVDCGTLDLSDAAATNCLFSNVRIDDAVTVAGDRTKFINCDFLGGGSASSGAVNNIFTGCQFGPDGGGGALTFTFDSGANNNVMTGCIADAAVVDNGTTNGIDYTLY